MAEFSNYPNEIDTTTQIPIATDNVTPVRAEIFNRLRDAVIKVEQELGIQPSSTYSTLKDRLDAIERRINDIGIEGPAGPAGPVGPAGPAGPAGSAAELPGDISQDSDANSIAQRTADGSLRASWIEADSNGQVANSGDIRLPINGTINARVTTGGGANARIASLSGTDLYIGSSQTSLQLFTTESEAIEFREGELNTLLMRLISGTPAAIKTISFDSEGRIKIFTTNENNVTIPVDQDVPRIGIYQHSGDLAAGNTVSERALTTFMLFPATIYDLNWISTANVASNPTNYARINIYKRFSAGGASTRTLIARINTSTSSMIAWGDSAFDPQVDQPITLEPDERITFDIEKVGSGVILPAATLIVRHIRREII